MKRSLMLLFALVIFVLPLSACGEDDGEAPLGEGQVRIKANLSKIDGEENDYRASDCASVSGTGVYDIGSKVNVNVEYNSNACTIVGYEINDDGQHREGTDSIGDSGINNYKFNFDASVSTTIEVFVKYQGSTATLNTNVHYDGLTKTSIVNSTKKTVVLDKEEYTFPYLKKTGNVKLRDEDKYSLTTSNNVLNKVLGQGELLNLNYIYLNGVIQPYKLTWKVGSWVSSTSSCNYDHATVLNDPNNDLLPTSEETCVMANIDVSSSVTSARVNNGINKMMLSEMTISTNNENNCYVFSGGSEYDPSINEECMYVARAKNLYNTNVDHTAEINGNASLLDTKLSVSSAYYAINESSLLEAVVTIQNGKKYYYLCKNSDYSNCRTEDTYYVDYPFTYSNGVNTAYTMLAISDFIDNLQYDSSKDTYKISASNITFMYSPILQDLVPNTIKGTGGVTYYINYLSDASSKDAAPVYKPTSPGINIPSNSLAALLYNIQFQAYIAGTPEENALINGATLSLKQKINSNTTQLMLSSSSEVTKNLRRLLYSTIDSEVSANENSSLKNLRNFKFNMQITGTNVVVSLESATIESVLLGASFAEVNDNVCYLGNSSSDTSESAETVDGINNCGTSSTADFELNVQRLANIATYGLSVVDIVTNGTVTTYTLKDITKDEDGNPLTYGGEEFEIKYDSSKNEFTDGKSTMTFKNSTQQTINLSKVTSTIKTVYGDVVQKLTVVEGEDPTITSTINDEEPNGLIPSTTEITALYTLLIDEYTTYHIFDGNEQVITCLSAYGDTYRIEYHSDLNDADGKFTITYKYTPQEGDTNVYEDVEYTLKATFENIE